MKQTSVFYLKRQIQRAEFDLLWQQFMVEFRFIQPVLTNKNGTAIVFESNGNEEIRNRGVAYLNGFLLALGL